jgi:hypothetical protein
MNLDIGSDMQKLVIPTILRPSSSGRKTIDLSRKKTTYEIIFDLLPKQESLESEDRAIEIEETPEPFNVIIPERRHLTHEATSSGFQRSAQLFHMQDEAEIDEDQQLFLQEMLSRKNN